MHQKNVNMDEDNSQQLTENLRELLKAHGLNTNQLANKLGIPVMTVRRLVLGETIDPRISTLKLIAEHFDVTVDSLLKNKAEGPINFPMKTRQCLLPILDWYTAKKKFSVSNFNLTEWNDWQPVLLNEQDAVGKNAFALKARPSMYPRFPQGTIFIIEPDIDPTDGDTVLVRIRKHNELTLRELVIDPPQWYLQPIISSSTPLQYDARSHEIVGVNLLTLLFNRKSCS